MLTEKDKREFIEALRKDPCGAQRVLKEMEAGKKINAIKELRILKTPSFGLRETKEFVELYYTYRDGNYSTNFTVASSKFIRDISVKGMKFDEYSEFDNIDIKQVSTKALMAFRKKLNKELKSRGKKL
jgi:hypothetical protein